jgi:hypothetical protein
VKFPALAACLALAALLAACTQPRDIAPGAAGADVVRSLGEPTARYPAADGGGQRLQYSSEPAGQTVYNMDLDAQGRVARVEQALREPLFAQRIRPGQWRRADALREYGKPAYVMGVRNFVGDIWVWRYVDGQTWRLLFIDIDPDGLVRGWSVGDEPLPDSDP